MSSHNDYNVNFNDGYNVYLENDKLGKVYIEYDSNFEDYFVKAEFTKAGKTNLIFVDENGNKTTLELTVGNNTYSINE